MDFSTHTFGMQIHETVVFLTFKLYFPYAKLQLGFCNENIDGHIRCVH